ncbi:MAG: hypothetical protein RDV48_03190 [Candidatus Eremiobacteraeota bacterium]|nr:hypothetical protein [Candidatus Eremiobacteraeota bacterium]
MIISSQGPQSLLQFLAARPPRDARQGAGNDESSPLPGESERAFPSVLLRYQLDERHEAYHAIAGAEREASLDARQDKINDDELKSLFGDEADSVRSLMNTRSDVKLSDLYALRKKPEDLTKAISFLNKRPDFKFSDLISRDIDGNVLLDRTELDPNMKLRKNIAEEAKAADYSDDDLQKLFDDQAGAVRELLRTRDDVKVGDLLPLRGDRKGITDLVKLLNERKDLKYDELVNKSADGKVTITWAVTDDQSKEIMETRKDIKPKELTKLFGTFVKAFDGDPLMAKKAYAHAARLLKNRSDMAPESVGKMVLDMSEQLETIRPTDPMAARRMNQTKLEMVESSVDLLMKRNDIQPEDVTKLSGAMVKSFGDKRDPMSLSRVSRAFKDTTQMLSARKDISISQVEGFMGNLDFAVPGRDPMSLENKASMLKGACTALKRNEGLNLGHMEQVLHKKSMENPAMRDSGIMLSAEFNRTAGALAAQAQPTPAQPAQDEVSGAEEKNDKEKQPEQGKEAGK